MGENKVMLGDGREDSGHTKEISLVTRGQREIERSEKLDGHGEQKTRREKESR